MNHDNINLYNISCKNLIIPFVNIFIIFDYFKNFKRIILYNLSSFELPKLILDKYNSSYLCYIILL